MDENTKFKIGDIILVSGIGFLPWAIQFFMNLYRRKKHLPQRKLYNHAAVIINLWGNDFIAEASRDGVRVLRTPEIISGDMTQKVATWIDPLSDQEKEEISRVAINYSLHPTRYDVLNFWYQMRMILSPSGTSWKGPKFDKARRRGFIVRSLRLFVWTRSGPPGEGETWDVNPLDLELHPELMESYDDPKERKILKL